ncbi:MAG: hypothetical protein JW862_10750 [Anaerolineales bacterium]|nr:hypothetical protein [Anaerolineales bacterium]
MPKRPTSPWPWLMLIIRLVLFMSIQALFAAGFWLAGSTAAWQSAANWWPYVVSAANVICLFVLTWLFRKDGRCYWDIFKFHRQSLKSDLLVFGGLMVLLGPIAFLPNIGLQWLLFGDFQSALDMILRPLPLWAAYASLLIFPVTQGLAELATYFLYAMPKLEHQGLPGWGALGLAALFLALQHIAVPLLFNVPFIIWRGLMFLPFALLVGIVLRWRPRLLPYLAIVHVLMDLSFAAMLPAVSV